MVKSHLSKRGMKSQAFVVPVCSFPGFLTEVVAASVYGKIKIKKQRKNKTKKVSGLNTGFLTMTPFHFVVVECV